MDSEDQNYEHIDADSRKESIAVIVAQKNQLQTANRRRKEQGGTQRQNGKLNWLSVTNTSQSDAFSADQAIGVEYGSG